MFKIIFKILGIQMHLKGTHKLHQSLSDSKEISTGKTIFYLFAMSKMSKIADWLYKIDK